MTFEELKPKVNDIITDTESLRDEKLKKICHLLHDNIDYYDWVGFYFANGDKPELILGPYAGEATDHTVIPFGTGICGQVAISNMNVKSEIVVPLFVNDKNIGQIDIDSNLIDAFGEDDAEFLKYVNLEISKLY